MTNGELGTIAGAIMTGLTGIGGVIRWAASRITTAIENGHAIVQLNTQALLGFTAAAAKMEGMIAQAHAASLKTQEAVEEVADEVSGVHEGPPSPDDGPSRRNTPAGGYSVWKRKGTRS